MATLAHLVSIGSLIKHEAELESGEMPDRFVYHDPALGSWLEDTLPSLPRDRSRNLTPAQQVDLILYEFVTRKPMMYGQDDRKLDPVHAHVWELKTEDVRLIGWFPCKATFVIVCGELKKNLRSFKDYAPYVARAVIFRDLLDLDEPKMLTGATHSHVL